MTTPVLKSLRPEDWPDRINAGKAVVRFPNSIESGSWYSRPQDDDKTVEYIRRDPAVLAELPEVKALVDAGTSLVSALCDDPDVMAKSHLVDLINELAAAIREGRNG